ncbi:hypothetical protein BV22DRAFT_1133855 [Leucogyrophana mollusca]|uniref:Uncharacterized protein n=1 Tax=Leucogyrophana mollusca TaxID=85980 RepID=A0ACB8B3G6_9AGAM|nr:hypothetical protein BV22DRAFT_1133855 [Leucogyrophana mollusca]
MSDDCVRQWTRLVNLSCFELTEDAVVHIAQMPSLKRLTMNLSPWMSFECASSHIPGSYTPFANVCDFYFRSLDLRALIDFINEMKVSPKNIKLEAIEITKLEKLEDLFSALTAHATEVPLERIIIKSDHVDPYWDEGFDPNHPITLDTIRPMFRFSNLHTLNIDYLCAFSLDDEALVAIARSGAVTFVGPLESHPCRSHGKFRCAK